MISPTPRTVYPADPTRDQPIGRNAHERKHLAMLERRLAFLRSEIETAAPYRGDDYDRAEIAALDWALRRVAAIEIGERNASEG